MAEYKVVNADELDAGLTSIGDAIREKTGGTELLAFPDGVIAEILKIVLPDFSIVGEYTVASDLTSLPDGSAAQFAATYFPGYADATDTNFYLAVVYNNTPMTNMARLASWRNEVRSDAGVTNAGEFIRGTVFDHKRFSNNILTCDFFMTAGSKVLVLRGNNL